MDRFWALLFGVCNLAMLLLCIISPSLGWWLPSLENADSYGSSADALFYFILYATGFFFVLTELLLCYFLWKYRYSSEAKSVYTHGHHRLEMIWTIVPAVILVAIAIVQIPAWAEMKYENKMPVPDQIIDVSARQFEWRMRYPDVATRETLVKAWKDGDRKQADAWGKNWRANIDDIHLVNQVHTWKSAKTRIYLSTRDVLHSFFLPNMRIKQDAVPGKVIPLWFEPTNANCKWDEDNERITLTTEDGEPWPLACTELCGWGHYKMQGHLYVHETKESYLAWLKYTKEQLSTRESDTTE